MPTALKRAASNRAADSSASSSSSGRGEPKPDIQPLRDLAKNFDLDIEPYLEEYLRLTEETLDEDGAGGVGGGGVGGGGVGEASSKKQQSFAAAALKIQNSVGIYNRKVDFLHQVVYQVFDDFVSSMLPSNNNSKDNKKGRHGGGDADVDEFHEFDADLEFLLLDEALPVDTSEGRSKINLKEISRQSNNGNGSSEVNATTLNATTNLDNTTLNRTGTTGIINNTTNGGGKTPDVTLLSLGGVMSATRIADQNGTFVIDRSSLDFASPSAMSRMLMANLQGGGNNGYSINGGAGAGGGHHAGEGSLRLLAGMCDVDANGALLMPGTKASVFVNGEAAANNKAEEVQIFPGGLSPGPGGGGGTDGSNDFGAGGIMDVGASFGNGDVGGDWGGDEDDGGGVGFRLNDDDEPMEDDDGNVGECSKADEGMEDRAAPASEDNNLPPKPKAIEDPWATLDPHESSDKDRPQPLRIGLTTRLPPGLDEDDRPSAAVTGSRTRKKGSKKKKKKKREESNSAAERAMNDFLAPPYLADASFDDTMSDDDDDMDGDEDSDKRNASFQLETKRHLKLLNKLKKRELIFGQEFEYVAKAHAKHRDAIRKQRRLQLRQEQQSRAKKKAADGENNVVDGFDDNEYGGGFDFGGDDDDNDSFGNPDFGNANDGNNESLHRSNVDFNAIDDVFGRCSRGGAFDEDNKYNNDDENLFENNGFNQTFEELCRAHLRKFAKSAEIYAAETQLTKRVANWQDGLAPLLEEQETRPEFDIHDCGRQILEKVERNIKVRKRISTGEKKLESSSSSSIVGQNNNVVAFSTIFGRDCEDYEVCRLFLSTLMLCNSGNVAVHSHVGGDGENVVESLDSLGIELLKSTFQPPMETFLAPSADNVEQNENEVMGSSILDVVDEDVSVF